MQFIIPDEVYLKPISYALSFVISIYAFWRIARKEGFVNTQIFDLYFVVLLCFFAVGYKFGLEAAMASSLFIFFIIVKVKSWSFKKLGDIAAIPATAGLALASLSTKNLILFGSLTLALAFLVYLRRNKLFGKSSTAFRIDRISKMSFNGALFYLSLLLLSLIAIIFFAGESIFRIAFYLLIILFSIFSMAMEIKKDKSAKKSMSDLFLKIKSDLLKKESSLEKQEKMLEMEDAYKVAGRADDNAEITDDAQEDIGHTITMRSIDALESAKKQVQKALGMLKKGKYGVCEKCSAKIDPARLKAYPETTLCLDCSVAKEARI